MARDTLQPPAPEVQQSVAAPGPTPGLLESHAGDPSMAKLDPSGAIIRSKSLAENASTIGDPNVIKSKKSLDGIEPVASMTRKSFAQEGHGDNKSKHELDEEGAMSHKPSMMVVDETAEIAAKIALEMEEERIKKKKRKNMLENINCETTVEHFLCLNEFLLHIL